MGLLAEWIAGEQLLGCAPRSGEVAPPEPFLTDVAQRVLEQVRQALPLGREAVVTEPFGEVSAVQLDGRLGGAIGAADALLEAIRVELDPGLRLQPDRVRLDLEDRIRVEPRPVERVADQPQRLAECGGARSVRVGPQVGGEGIPRPGPARQDEEREQCLGVAAAQPDGCSVVGRDLDTTEQVDVEGSARADRDLTHV